MELPKSKSNVLLHSARGVPNGVMEKGELLFQCAESKLFECNFYGTPAIVKHRFRKEYRHPVLDQKLREQRTVREARALVRCRKLGVPAPVVFHVDRANCIIVMERIAGITARDVIHGCSNEATRTAVAKALLESIGELVGRMHQGDMIHGDLTTSNFLVMGDQFTTPSSGGSTADVPTTTTTTNANARVPLGEAPTHHGVVVIDFGLVSEKNSAEDRAVDLYVLERAVASAHPLLEHVSENILTGYFRSIEPQKGKQTMDRLLAVRARGRKRSMVG